MYQKGHDREEVGSPSITEFNGGLVLTHRHSLAASASRKCISTTVHSKVNYGHDWVVLSRNRSLEAWWLIMGCVSVKSGVPKSPVAFFEPEAGSSAEGRLNASVILINEKVT